MAIGGSTMRFGGRVALVTGAASGIGRASASMIARGGALVGCLDCDEGHLREVVREIDARGATALPLVADVSDAAAVDAAVAGLVERGGRLDIVVASAGINGVWGPIDEIEPAEWDHTIDVNLKGTFLTLKHATPHLRARGGAVVIVSSGQGTRSFTQPGSHAYACSKAAQAVLAKKLALELARHKVRVNVVCPGSTYTNINASGVRRSMDKITLPIEYPDGKVLLKEGRKGEPEQVARLVSFLVSDDADLISGSEVWIDGTMSLVMG